MEWTGLASKKREKTYILDILLFNSPTIYIYAIPDNLPQECLIISKNVLASRKLIG